MRFDRILAFAQVLTFGITAITSVPLFVLYIKNMAETPIFIHLHVWFGVAFTIVAIIKISDRKRVLLRQLGLHVDRKNKNAPQE